MNRTIHKACVWSFVAMSSLLGIALILAHLFPPPSPTESAARVASYYVDHQVRVQIGLVLAMMASALWVPFAAALSWEVRKMTGGRPAVATIIVIMCGAGFLLALVFPFTIFMAATFGPTATLRSSWPSMTSAG